MLLSTTNGKLFTTLDCQIFGVFLHCFSEVLDLSNQTKRKSYWPFAMTQIGKKDPDHIVLKFEISINTLIGRWIVIELLVLGSSN